MPLWAVHISDGVLTFPFWAGGFLLAGLFLLWGSWKTQEDEVPRIALLTAAFFIASTIHVKVPPTSVHLLLNGLAGAILGRRAVLVVAGGLFLQALLLGHGGFYALGVNTCVMTLPAYLAWGLFHSFRRLLGTDRGLVCSCLVFTGSFILVLSSTFSGAMVGRLLGEESGWLENLKAAGEFSLQPLSLVVALALACLATWAERRLHATPTFALGFFVGSVTVLATSGLNCLVLLAGGEDIWPVAPWAMVVLHLPVAVIEGMVMGASVGFLSRVKPELLDHAGPEWKAREAPILNPEKVAPIAEEVYNQG